MAERKLKIGFFCDTYLPMVDGVISVMNNYIRTLKDEFDFYLIVPKAPKDYIEKDIGQKGIIRIKMMKVCFLDYGLPLPGIDRNLKNRLKNLNLDAVVLHSSFSLGKYGYKYAKKHNIPSIIFAHSLMHYDFRKSVKIKWFADSIFKGVIKFYNKPDLVVAVGEGVKKVYSEKYKIKNNIKVIDNATSFKYLEDNKLVDNLRSFHKIKNDEKIYLFVGRINYIKNIDFILKSLEILNKKDPNFKMIFVGEGIDLAKFKKDVSKSTINNKVIFAGRVVDKEKLKAYYKLADLFLFPSYYDASSIVQKEAASQKTPVVFLENATTATGFTDGKECFIAKNSPKDYANKIFEAIHNKDIYNKVSENAYKYMYKTWENSSILLKNIILEEINKKKKDNKVK